MKPGTVFLLLGMLVLTASTGIGQEPPSALRALPPEYTLVGQLLLPDGSGSRGIEIIVEITQPESEPRRVWTLFDEQGRFSHKFEGKLGKVVVAAGIGREIDRIDTDQLPAADQAHRIDIGTIDLRSQLVRHTLQLRAAEDKPDGVVRIGMFFGPPSRGPQGEMVSLGSRQFPPVPLPGEVEWLLPHEADSIYFLIERPDGPGRGIHWRSGHQRLFGPFTSADFPTDLVMD